MIDDRDLAPPMQDRAPAPRDRDLALVCLLFAAAHLAVAAVFLWGAR